MRAYGNDPAAHHSNILFKEVHTMNVHATSRDFTNRELYVLTQSDGAKPVKEAVGTTLEVVDWLRYDYIGQDPETKQDVEREAVTLITAEGERFRSINKAFVERFDSIIETLGDEPVGALDVLEKESNQGRKYLTCALGL